MGISSAPVIFHLKAAIYIRVTFQFITLQCLFITVHVVWGVSMLFALWFLATLTAWPGDGDVGLSVHRQTEISQQLLDELP